jgi:uncharacterized membrane protein YccC
METSTSELIKNFVGSAVRWILVLVGGILVKKGIISSDQSNVYVSQFTPVLIGVAMAGVALVWSLWQKKHANTKVDVALTMQAGADRAQLEQKVTQT